MVTKNEAYNIGATKLTELGFTPLDSCNWSHPDGRIGRLGVRLTDFSNLNSPVAGVILHTAAPTRDMIEIVTF